MASMVLYPPVVDSYMPAFQAGDEKCVVYFRLSKFNSSIDFKTVHATVVKQDTGTNMVKKTDNEDSISINDKGINYTRYRSTGIILNIQPIKVEDEDDLYYIEIYSSDLSPAWTMGWTYKIQLRLSAIDCPKGNKAEQAKWLKDSASNFSEWSTVCVVKTIGEINYKIPFLGISTENDNNASDLNKTTEETEIESTILDLSGSFSREDKTELVHSYRFTLYDESNENVIEDSDELYCDQYQDVDSFKYLFKTELQNNSKYYLGFQYETNNKYIGGHYKPEDRYFFTCLVAGTDLPPCIVITAESDPSGYFINPPEHYHENEDENDSPSEISTSEDITSSSKKDAIQKENDEARLGVKFYSESDVTYTGNLCIRRTDSYSDFKEWVDIFIYPCNNKKINDIPIFYDYTIESGVFYKYGVQVIGTGGIRGDLLDQPILAMREFEYSLLLGKNKKQLNFKFNNEMNNFKYQIYDSKIDPIGSQYPVVARNANTYYRTFPLNGIISFNMDNEMTFSDRIEVLGTRNIDESYYAYKYNGNHIQYMEYYGQVDDDGKLIHKDHYPNMYDYTYEKNFRNLVLKFLQDGEVKLFKSPTEGNILVRLTDVNCTPIQSTNRLIYSFSSTAYEIDECTIDNYIKYGLWSIDDWVEDFYTIKTKLGQISTEITLPKENNVNSNSNNITYLVKQKYDGSGKNIAGRNFEVLNYHHIKITFEGKPLKIKNQNSPENEYLLGNNFSFKGKPITVFAPNRFYEFEDEIKCGMNEEFSILGDAENTIFKIPVTVDFLYDIKDTPYETKKIKTRKTYRGIGQVFQECYPEENILMEVYLRYQLEVGDQFSTFAAFQSIDIEASQGAVFKIKDNTDTDYEYHVVGATERLSFIDISNIRGLYYMGMQDPVTGEIIKQNTDVLMNYVYLVQKGTYKT